MYPNYNPSTHSTFGTSATVHNSIRTVGRVRCGVICHDHSRNCAQRLKNNQHLMTSGCHALPRSSFRLVLRAFAYCPVTGSRISSSQFMYRKP